MANGAGTVEVIISEYGRALATLENLPEGDEYQRLLAELGIDAPPDLTADPVFLDKLEDVALAAEQLHAGIDDVTAQIEMGELSDVVAAAASLLGDCVSVIGALDEVGFDLPRATASLNNASEVAALAPNLTDRTLENVLAGYLEFAHPVGAAVLRLFGVIEVAYVQLDFSPDGVPIVRRRLFLGRLPTALTNPVEAWRVAYAWGQNDFNEQKLLASIGNFFNAIGALIGLPDDDSGVPALLEMLGLTIQRSTDTPPGLEAGLYFNMPDSQIVLAQLTNRWRFQLDLGGTFSEGLGIKLLPPFNLVFSPPSGSSFEGHVGLVFAAQSISGSDNVELFSITSGCRIDAQNVTVGPAASLIWNGTSATAEFGIRLEVRRGRVVVQSNEADGFLSSLLPADGLAVNFDSTLSWSPSKGLRFEGGAGLLLTLLTNEKVGPIIVQSLVLGLNINTDAVSVSAGVNVATELGPITAVVQNVGVRLEAALASRGSLGPGDLSIRFQPPNGIGIIVDSGPVSGGGFLSFDRDKGRYAGALELKVFSISVKAFGLLDTKLPDGTEGYSFVIVIVAEFTPIQLGFGFTLIGVGGLLGINRTVNSDALSAAVRTGSLEHVLFPHDVVANAPAIINDLASIFPAALGHYIFGPMGKLGWGTPTLITADLGILLEFPGPRLGLLGVLRMQLPKPDAALLSLQMAVAGLLDFPAKSCSVDASIYESTVVGMPITGDMAFRIHYGSKPTFLLSVGGFNPGFKTPPAFPKLNPCAVDLGVHGNPSLVASGYFALTSNSAQIGAGLDLRAHGAGIQLHGWLTFDALFVFSPFSFSAGISAGVRVSFHGVGLGVSLGGTLSGPSPWHFKGKACVSVLWWDACLPIDIKFGPNTPAAVPEVDPWYGTGEQSDARVEVLGLQSAVQDTRNWSGSAPPEGYTVVSLAAAATDANPPIDPLGPATLHQTVCPLNKTLEKFGEYKPTGHNRFDFTSATVNSGEPITDEDVTYVKDLFVPGHFSNLPNDKKLSQDSYVEMTSGITLSPNAVTLGSTGHRTLDYETALINDEGERSQPPGVFGITDTELRAILGRCASARGGIRRSGNNKYMLPGRPKLVTFINQQFVVADPCTRQVNLSITPTPVPRVQAEQALLDWEAKAQNAEEVGRYMVLPKAA